MPNPLAKNPNFHTHKVFAAIGIILTALIIIIALLWYFTGSSLLFDNNEEDITKVSTSSAKKATDSSSKNADEEWVTYKGKNIYADFSANPQVLINYSFQHPKAWKEAYTATQGFAVISSHYENWLDDPPPGRFDVSATILNSGLNKTGVKTIFGGKEAWRKITDEKVDGLNTRTLNYQVESIKTLQGDMVNYDLQCRYFIGTDVDFETICDKIASSFKLL